MAKTAKQLRVQLKACPLSPKGRKHFSKELKLEILELVRSSDLSISRVCRDIGISTSTVRDWLGKFKMNSDFSQVTIVEEPKLTPRPDLILESPKGFRLTGSIDQIEKIWRDIHAQTS